MRILLLSVLILTICSAVVLADENNESSNNLTSLMIENKFAGGEPLPNIPAIPYTPNLATDSPGELVGTTQYDYQTNGSTGRRIALDSQGGVHFAWMNGTNYPTTREVSYNYVDANGNWLGSSAVSQANGAGYCNIAVTNDDRAVVAYHQWQLSPYAVIAIDGFSGFGIWDYYDPQDMLGFQAYWPYHAVDNQGYIHNIVVENSPNAGDPQVLGYSRSEDGGQTWSAIATVDTLINISQNVVASKVSNKVAILYTHPITTDDQWHNDIYYIESSNGTDWDWRNGKVNITNYGAPDSLYAYTDLSAVYDYNDDLNIVWTAQWVSDEGIYYRTDLYHYNTSTQTITEIDHHPDSLWAAGCEYGAWNRPISKMSIGVNYGGSNLFVAYTKFDDQDCSLGGYANGEIYLDMSENQGATWPYEINLTNSPTPGCTPGDCDSDHWSTIAEIVDSELHLIFIEDKDAGGIAQDEGIATTNPVKYLTWSPLGIEENNIPTTFNLNQNYPNPFNANTTISFNLEIESDVELNVYDITGAKVSTLVDKRFVAGKHSVAWDASAVASGIYFYTLKANDESQTISMTLLK